MEKKIVKSMKKDLYIHIECKCGRKIRLELIGGQYQNDYKGTCACGKEWLLIETSAEDPD